jgi:hypothetical protein
MFILDPAIFCHPGSLIWMPDPDTGSYIKKKGAKKPIFFLPDQKMNVGKVHKKFNFSYFSIFLKRIQLIIYKFHFSKFNFSHVWDLGSEIQKKIIPDPDPG